MSLHFNNIYRSNTTTVNIISYKKSELYQVCVFKQPSTFANLSLLSNFHIQNDTLVCDVSGTYSFTIMNFELYFYINGIISPDLNFVNLKKNDRITVINTGKDHCWGPSYTTDNLEIILIQ